MKLVTEPDNTVTPLLFQGIRSAVCARIVLSVNVSVMDRARGYIIEVVKDNDLALRKCRTDSI